MLSVVVFGEDNSEDDDDDNQYDGAGDSHGQRDGNAELSIIGLQYSRLSGGEERESGVSMFVGSNSHLLVSSFLFEL